MRRLLIVAAVLLAGCSTGAPGSGSFAELLNGNPLAAIAGLVFVVAACITLWMLLERDRKNQNRKWADVFRSYERTFHAYGDEAGAENMRRCVRTLESGHAVTDKNLAKYGSP